MIRHTLLFRFNEGVEEGLRQEAISRLEQLGELCPSVASWSIGTNIADSI